MSRDLPPKVLQWISPHHNLKIRTKSFLKALSHPETITRKNTLNIKFSVDFYRY